MKPNRLMIFLLLFAFVLWSVPPLVAMDGMMRGDRITQPNPGDDEGDPVEGDPWEDNDGGDLWQISNYPSIVILGMSISPLPFNKLWVVFVKVQPVKTVSKKPADIKRTEKKSKK